MAVRSAIALQLTFRFLRLNYNLMNHPEELGLTDTENLEP